MFSDWKEGEAMHSRTNVKHRTAAIILWPVTILGSLFLLVSGALLLALILLIAIRDFRSFRDRIRQFNKRTLNPAILTFAGRPHRYYAVVHHVGRRTGHSYYTPVVAEQTADGFVIPLPYGKQVDWCRNVLDAGRCAIQWNGCDYTVGEPELIDAATAFPMMAPLRRLTLRVLGDVQFLKVKRLADIPEAVSLEA